MYWNYLSVTKKRNCGNWRMDRKDFFKHLINKGLDIFLDHPVISSLEETAKAKERPPGAVLPDATFQQLCTGCDACMIACPVNVIMVEDLNTRYPVIYPETAPCLHCTGYPCIQSCKTTALTMRLHENK